MDTVAFLGIGLMGAPMAQRLAQAGYRVQAWNRTPAKANALASAGAHPAASIAEAVRGARHVVSMLSDGAAVAACVGQALPALASGTLWIDMSSTAHAEALALAAQLQAQGMRFVDAPVSGEVAGAQAGTLAIMVGGTPEDVAEAVPLLGVFGTPRRVGPAGSGQVAKLCNQLIVGATLAVVAEALLLAQAAGAEPAAVREAIRGGFAGSRILEVHGQRMLDRQFLPGGQVKTQLKDMHNILAAAGDAGLHLPMTETATRQYAAIVDTLPQADHAAALIALERMNPGCRLGAQPDQLP